MAERLGSRDYRCAAERIRAGAALERGAGPRRGGRAPRGRPRATARYPAPLEAWKAGPAARGPEVRLGDKEAARAAFAEAARSVNTIAAGVRDEALREGFLRLPAVREVLEGAGRARRIAGEAVLC